MSELLNWIPYKLERQDGLWQIRWMDLDNWHISEPFFDETIGICLSKMSERSMYRSMSDTGFLLESCDEIDAITPTAFIFHVSRCGSTLLSQALSTDQGNIVYAEAPLLDEILRAPIQDKNLTETETEKWFKAALKIMGQQRKSQYQQLFIKLDSWHIHFYPLLRKWFPETPFYFLTRKPDAVIVSHHKRRGVHAIPGFIEADLLKVNLKEEHYSDFNFFTAEMLTAYYRELHNLVEENIPLNYFYDYSWGMENLLTHFFASIGKENAKENEMKKRLSFHSKYPDQPFNEEAKIEIPAYQDANLVYKHLISALSAKHRPKI